MPPITRNSKSQKPVGAILQSSTNTNVNHSINTTPRSPLKLDGTEPEHFSSFVRQIVDATSNINKNNCRVSQLEQSQTNFFGSSGSGGGGTTGPNVGKRNCNRNNRKYLTNNKIAQLSPTQSSTTSINLEKPQPKGLPYKQPLFSNRGGVSSVTKQVANSNKKQKAFKVTQITKNSSPQIASGRQQEKTLQTELSEVLGEEMVFSPTHEQDIDKKSRHQLVNLNEGSRLSEHESRMKYLHKASCEELATAYYHKSSVNRLIGQGKNSKHKRQKEEDGLLKNSSSFHLPRASGPSMTKYEQQMMAQQHIFDHSAHKRNQSGPYSYKNSQ